ncbi:MAG: DNA-binding LytR/AlgR family response regulator [Cellvibrionaceae bacterium]|jgi:DNA-binding LytR/AlgR family response regulator
MRILVTDDEKPARKELSYILSQLVPEVDLSEAKSGQEAIDFLTNNRVDVAFLDINMPGVDGLTAGVAIMEMANPPLLVFATAYSDYAIRAFEMAALDYVVKPFDERRLAKTITRIRETLAKQNQMDQQQEAVRAVLAQIVGRESVQPESERPFNGIQKLWGERESGARRLVDFKEILYIEAEQKRVFMAISAGEKLQIRQTLKELEERLPLDQFMRVHKGYMINLNYIAEVVPWFSGSYLIKLKDGSIEIPMSRRYAAKLKELTDW